MAVSPNQAGASARATLLHPFAQLHDTGDIQPMTIVRGRGIFVYDAEGQEYLEAMSGMWCVGLGFSDEELIEAAHEQMRALPSYHIFGHVSLEPAERLADKLKQIAPVPVSRVFLTNSGSEATETQVKLAWYYNNIRGKPTKKAIISRVNAFHGSTIMAGSLTGISSMHDQFDLPAPRVLFTDCPDYANGARPEESEADFVVRMAHNLRRLIERVGSDNIAAMIAEPIMSGGGVIMPPDGYFAAIQAVLDEHDIYLIGDEVVSGFGRTGNWWGCQTVGMKPASLCLPPSSLPPVTPRSPLVYNIRSRGLIGAFDLAQGPRRPFEPCGLSSTFLRQALVRRGVIVRNLGFDTIALAPPMIISEAEIDLLFDRIEEALRDTADYLTREGLLEND